MFNDFKKFALKGNVIDMAVGVIIGGAFGKIVTSLVNDIIMPFISVLTANINFADLKYTLVPAVVEVVEGVETVTTAAVTVNYGMFIQNIVNFAIIAFCLFIMVKLMNKLKNPKPVEEAPAAPAPKPDDIQLLEEIRDLLAKETVNQ